MISKKLGELIIKLINFAQRNFLSEMTREEFQEIQKMKSDINSKK